MPTLGIDRFVSEIHCCLGNFRNSIIFQHGCRYDSAADRRVGPLFAPILLLEHVADAVVRTKAFTVRTLLETVQTRRDMPTWLAIVSIQPAFSTTEALDLLEQDLLDSTEPVYKLIKLLGDSVSTMPLHTTQRARLLWPTHTYDRNTVLLEIARSEGASLTPVELGKLATCLQHFWADPDFTKGLGSHCRMILESAGYAKVVAKQTQCSREAVCLHFSEKLVSEINALAENDRTDATKVCETAQTVYSAFLGAARTDQPQTDREPMPESNARGRRGQRSRRRNNRQPRAQGGPTAWDPNLKCYNCGGTGHKRNVCPSPVKANS